MTQAYRLDELPLHDAILRRVELAWAEKCCRVYLEASAVPGRPAAPHVLEFRGVSLLRVPHSEQWGPSTFINQARGSPLDGFEIEMQSGDVIEIAGNGFAFRPSN